MNDKIITPAGFIIVCEHAVMAIGATEAEARAEFASVVGEFDDATRIHPASQALLDMIADVGGTGISWDEVDGVKCTAAEAAAARGEADEE